jgi:hypothetical protein
MTISYAITVCDELDEIVRLLNLLLEKKRKQDEIVVLFDTSKQSGRVEALLIGHKNKGNIRLVYGKFDSHFADWKNKLTENCSGDYIFQIDADEYPSDYLLEFLPSILESNPDAEAYHVPRINTVEGLTQEHIRQWGWRVSPEGWVNFPDNQWRIWKKKPCIKWVNKVHERLDGFKSFIILPSEPDFCLIHPKTIERQERQNNYYNTL